MQTDKYRIGIVVSFVIVCIIGLVVVLQRQAIVKMTTEGLPDMGLLTNSAPTVTAIHVTNFRYGETISYPIAMLTGYVDLDPQTFPANQSDLAFVRSTI